MTGPDDIWHSTFVACVCLNRYLAPCAALVGPCVPLSWFGSSLLRLNLETVGALEE